MVSGPREWAVDRTPMTPRQADVAFVLESVPGIRAVYAIDHERVDFAIESEEGSSGVRAFEAAPLCAPTRDEP